MASPSQIVAGQMVSEEPCQALSGQENAQGGSKFVSIPGDGAALSTEGVCRRWGTGSEQCILHEEHLGPCRTEATRVSENPLLDASVGWMLTAIAGRMPDEAYAFAKMAARASGRTE